MKDEIILRALNRQDADAMNHIIEKYSRLLWPIADAVLKDVGTTQDVEECVADAFIQLWEHPEKFDPSRGSLKSYLCILVRSRAIDCHRRLIRQTVVSLEELPLAEALSTQDLLFRRQTKQALEEALQQLEAPAREILLRRYYYSQKPRQIALAMGFTVKQVDNSLYHTKKKLRTLLTEKGATPWAR